MVQKSTLINNIRNKIIAKPQQYFDDKIDNSYLPFLPKIRVKQNAVMPLQGKYFKLFIEKLFNFLINRNFY
jgi:hypothetical protein